MRIVCPMCRKVIENAPEDHPPRPFCSPSCKLADLDNWLSGRYRIPATLDEGSDVSLSGTGEEDEGPN